MNEVVTYQECFKLYPDQWVLLDVVTRDKTNGALIRGRVRDTSINKQDIIDKSKLLKKLKVDVAIVCTIDKLEEAVSFVYFDNGLEPHSYVSPEEYSYIFMLYCGLAYKEYLGE